ncbi:hypothetical protein NP92_04240 [Anoxybacillus gonensis]|uniref:Uncharacterized protein n=1 Tax=Anoxybacillus gonensis TaxID=198467 RepID=A0AAW7TFL8_9BACL|nr:hypothetical protein [Anoxybacillus gonensis]AKS37684.1 hypothetical protein AFK25_03810 [Anoxybacillus gonensis]KGP61606.1 hypothetical protein NP92_04240 [Anoxybacillus gonensis]MDO0876498.1 hypothetical protein [Anoxybacillus gonensis]
MAEITSSAYQAIRDYIQANWQYIELRDDLGNPILRLSPSDSRVTSTIEGQTVKLQIVVKGSDADITKPQTFASSAIYDVATGGQPYSIESFTSFTIESDMDELTVIHEIQVPQVV